MLRLYARCSTDDQSIESQRPDLERFASDQDAAWYADEGYTGTNLNRPAWKQLMSDLRNGDQVVVVALDRMCRDTADFVNTMKLLHGKGVTFRSLREGVDTSTPFGEAMLEIIAVFAKLETRIRRARQTAGIQAARKANGGKCPWGGRRRGTRVKVTTEKEQTIRRLRDEHQSVASIARVVGLTRKTVYRVLAGAGASNQREGVDGNTE